MRLKDAIYMSDVSSTWSMMVRLNTFNDENGRWCCQRLTYNFGGFTLLPYQVKSSSWTSYLVFVSSYLFSCLYTRILYFNCNILGTNQGRRRLESSWKNPSPSAFSLSLFSPSSSLSLAPSLPSLYLFRLDALALSVIATATWLGGWLGGWVAGCHTPVLYQNR